jgi:hypothetical protein
MVKRRPTWALSRTMHPDDYAKLEGELLAVDAVGIGEQHLQRRWEYGLALHALGQWYTANGISGLHAPIYDVGGSGSTFARIVERWVERPVTIIDPRERNGQTLRQAIGAGRKCAQFVTCLSVLEHVDNVEEFVTDLAALVGPGGLLVLTMDYWNKCGPDTAHFHWMRSRIFCPKTLALLRHDLRGHGFRVFGETAYSYKEPQVYDYTFASLVVERYRC